jgi:hypothetical protein
MEEVRVDLQEGEEVLGGLEEGGPEVDVEVVGDELKQLVDVQRASSVHGLSKELDELVRDDWIDPVLLRLPEGGRDLPLVLLEEDNLLLDDKLLGISSQKVFELLDVLPGDMSHLWWSLRAMTKEAFDRHFCSRSILPKFVLEVVDGFVHIVSVGRASRVTSNLDSLGDGDPLSVHGEKGRVLLQELSETGLRTTGYLSHLFAESFGPKLAG